MKDSRASVPHALCQKLKQLVWKVLRRTKSGQARGYERGEVAPGGLYAIKSSVKRSAELETKKNCIWQSPKHPRRRLIIEQASTTICPVQWVEDHSNHPKTPPSLTSQAYTKINISPTFPSQQRPSLETPSTTPLPHLSQ